MLKNYIQIALRVLFRNKVFSFINILGLVVGLTSCLLIYIYASGELSYDRQHDDYNRIFRIVVNEKEPDGIHKQVEIPYPVVRTIKENIAGVEKSVFIYSVDHFQITIDDKIYQEPSILFTSADIASIFDIELVAGDINSLNEPNKVLITESIARKYFGNKSPMGKVINMINKLDFEIVGVVKDAPYNMHLPYSFIASEASLTNKFVGFNFDRWSINIGGFYCYLKLNKGVNKLEIQNQINKTIHKISDTNDEDKMYLLQDITDIHLNPDYKYDSRKSHIANPRFIIALSLIGLFILIIACINYVNLATVQTVKRAKEIGIRKVLGASKRKLIFQNLSETFLFVLFAEIVAVIMSEIIWPQISRYFQLNTQLSIYPNLHIFLFLSIILIVVVAFSGLYPAFVLSRFSPIKTLKSNTMLKSTKGFSLRNILVVFQFVITQVLIIASIFIALQIKFIHTKDMGFQKEDIWIASLPMIDNSRYAKLKEELLQIPEIEKVTCSLGGPISTSGMSSEFNVPNTDDWLPVEIKPVDENYNNIFGMKIIEGRWLKEFQPGDSIFEFVVNETFVNKMGVEKISDAIDERLKIASFPAKIVGVTKNFNIASLREGIGAVAMGYYNRLFVTVAFKAKMTSSLKQKIKKAWKNVYPEYLLQMQYYNDKINVLYQNETNTFKLILFFSFIAIVIACLGLYGLISYIVVQRTKEISIRKVLGAPVINLVNLVTRQFIYLVAFSCLIAWPIAFYLVKSWLNNYAYKIDLNFWIFIIAAIILLVITLLTILYQAIKISLVNPVDTLKYE